MKILGLTDSVNTCDCCGKTGLARTVAIQIDEDIVYYGTTCATRKHGVNTSIKALSEIEAAKDKANNIQEFIKIMKDRSFGNTKVLSPIYDNVPYVTWIWGDVKITADLWTN